MAGDVEQNPGPETRVTSSTEIRIISYNVRGLKDKLKLKRVLNKCYSVLKETPDSFILIQETHLDLTDCDQVGLLWRHGFYASPGIGRQGGTLILFNSTWEVIKKSNDEQGRFCALIVSRHGQQLCIGNLYAPNDHDLDFFTSVYNQIYDLKSEYPDSKIILAGDFNLVLGQGDSKNRSSNNAEKRSRKFIVEQNELLGLKDSYRVANLSSGYTWSRGNCMSRLDMILISKELTHLGVKSKLDWGFDISDHAMLETTFRIKNILSRGKGLYKVNTSVLENQHTLEEVRSELVFQISLIPEHWDAHKKLDYVKMTIRSVIGLITGREAQREESELKALANQLNFLRLAKEKAINENTTTVELDRAIRQLETEHKEYLDKKSIFLARRSGAKWFEEGERNNAYFLNLINKRKEQTLIVKLKAPGRELTDQTEIMSHIVNFYTELYSDKDTDDNFDELLSDLPELCEADRTRLDEPIGLSELESTLRSSSETAPGLDGISYEVYKKLWPEVGPFLLDAWNFSNQIGLLPEDQRVSCITLLPKAGKDLEKIENWRPITLTNCDLKIFTKLLSNRVSKVLDRIISTSQTAYIPGRVVHDNLRVYDFYKNYCSTHDIDGLLISLDAKKAFDSVSHKYLREVLKRYGFSDGFIETVKLLYKDIKANIMVNGYKSVMIKIARSVKQGDALSCALFILCIDPLMRKMEANQEIESIPIPRSNYSNIKVSGKVAGFADDIGLAVKNNQSTINAIFRDYALFSKLSGIELNIDKTEILKLNVISTNIAFTPVNLRVEDKVIGTSESIKICGVVFSNNRNVAYQTNVLDKIVKLEKQIIRWLPRYLSLEGKITIVKTFGLSQLIYTMQMCEIKQEDVKRIESIIFKFLWNKKWVGNSAPDRIKRDILKMPYSQGGLKVPDIQALDNALKTKQFIRAMNSNHQINLVQKFVMEGEGYYEIFKIEYAKVSNLDVVTSSYQKTTNFLTDLVRTGRAAEVVNNDEFTQIRANIIASTDIIEYFKKKNIPLVIYRFRELAQHGIESFHHLLNEARYPRSNRLQTCAREILSFFPNEWIEIVSNMEDIDASLTYSNMYLAGKWQLIDNSKITVKSLREILSVKSSGYVKPYLNQAKFELSNLNEYEHNPFLLVRQAMHAPRDRFYKYRILHGDVFCKSRMFKFKMVDSPHCSFCPNEIETVKHVIWDCPRSTRAWEYLESQTREALGREYLSYNTIILGNPEPNMAMETMITWTLKLIMAINREELINNEVIANKFSTLFYYEKKAFGLNSKKMKSRWGNLIVRFNEEI